MSGGSGCPSPRPSSSRSGGSRRGRPRRARSTGIHARPTRAPIQRESTGRAAEEDGPDGQALASESPSPRRARRRRRNPGGFVGAGGFGRGGEGRRSSSSPSRREAPHASGKITTGASERRPPGALRLSEDLLFLRINTPYRIISTRRDRAGREPPGGTKRETGHRRGADLTPRREVHMFRRYVAPILRLLAFLGLLASPLVLAAIARAERAGGKGPRRAPLGRPRRDARRPLRPRRARLRPAPRPSSWSATGAASSSRRRPGVRFPRRAAGPTPRRSSSSTIRWSRSTGS